MNLLISETHLRSERDSMRITCTEAGCGGCQWVHRVLIGETRYYLDEERISEAVYREECERLRALEGGQ